MDSINPDPSNIPDDDLELQNYQDDLDTSSSITDPIIDEENDDPTKELGVDPKEFKNELDKYDFDDTTNGDDDRREDIEDKDLDEYDTTKY
jgi:hypothetical protein